MLPSRVLPVLSSLFPLLIIALCTMSAPNTVVGQDMLPTFDVRCYRLTPTTDFFEKIGLKSRIENTTADDDVFVLDEIESFFLFSRPREPRPDPISIPLGKAAHVFDNTRANAEKYWVKVSASIREGTEANELTITAGKNSRFRLKSELTLSVPDGGSAIVRTADRPQDGRTVYLMINVRRNDGRLSQ